MLKRPRLGQKIDDCVNWPFLVGLLFLLIELTKKEKRNKKSQTEAGDQKKFKKSS